MHTNRCPFSNQLVNIYRERKRDVIDKLLIHGFIMKKMKVNLYLSILSHYVKTQLNRKMIFYTKANVLIIKNNNNDRLDSI